MSLTTLPAEVLDEIIYELRTYFGDDNSDSVEAGKALSLVCRRLKPFGQALRWRNTQCHILKTRSLAIHFSRYPFLASLVINFQTPPPNQTAGTGVSTKWELSALSSILSQCTELRELHFRVLQGLPSLKLLQIISQNTRLRQLSIFFEDPLEWSPKIASIFAEGFPSLESLTLEASEFRLPKRRRPEGSGSRQERLRVGLLRLGWVCEEGEEGEVIDAVLSTLDVSGLEEVVLAGSAACSRMLEELTLCDCLVVKLRFFDDQHSITTLSSFVELLPRFQVLAEIGFEMHDSSEAQSFDLPVSRLLEAWCPTLMRIYAIKPFGGYDSIPKRQLESSTTGWAEYQTLMTVIPLETGDHESTIIWRAKGTGDLKWYRHIDVF